jgi:hypothetical protein
MSELPLATGGMKTAVLFLVFNRPDTTAQVFEAIRKAKPPRLYVAADGPRASISGEDNKVRLVREIAAAVDWPCQVKTLFRMENIGCKDAVSGGINWFFEHEEEGIILEDDTLPSQSFFYFCEEMLDYYRSNLQIMSVTGTNVTRGIPFAADVWYSNYALMWGWATWRRAWQKYDGNLSTWLSTGGDAPLKKIKFLNSIEKLFWKKILNNTAEGGVNTWDYQWIYSCWVNRGLTIAPKVNLVRNIGYSPDATHTTEYHPILSNLLQQEMNFPVTYPKVLEANYTADKFISSFWFGITWSNFFKHELLKLPFIYKLNKLLKRR